MKPGRRPRRGPRGQAGQRAVPRRVAVVSPQTRLALARRTRTGRRVVLTADFDATRARAVQRRQQRLALVSMALLCTLVLGLPLLLSQWQTLGRVRLLEVPLSWLLLGVLPYPALLALGWAHLRAAEHVETQEVGDR